ncbi:MAG TPA: class I SAM-dependent methyltransferase [Bryobacteraceae bacterium]|nr:class I SAM-dependent methyltransferase [Bryobacteraceae bacterium]
MMAGVETGTVRLLCPACREPGARLDEVTEAGALCRRCGFRLLRMDGIVRALAPGRRQHYARFLADYAAIRHAEGRGSPEEDYYRALPYEDRSGRNSAQWAIRGRTWRYFETHVLTDRKCDVLDLGAGNGWMSWRLAQRGHRPVAVDIFTDALDGLGAARHYGGFPLVEAEFDRLPFADAQFDLAIFNASFHYSTDYRRTLQEARRCLRAGAPVVILDSPIYRRREHGERMREERHVQFQETYGFRSDSIPSLEYLWDGLLRELERELGIAWSVYYPWYGWKWFWRPWKARLERRRPPSRFAILVGHFEQP